jgi:broad specificity phosphatase PhoE
VRGAGKIFLILHGETALNFAGCGQGRSDSPLTHRGRGEGAVFVLEARKIVKIRAD